MDEGTGSGSEPADVRSVEAGRVRTRLFGDTARRRWRHVWEAVPSRRPAVVGAGGTWVGCLTGWWGSQAEFSGSAMAAVSLSAVVIALLLVRRAPRRGMVLGLVAAGVLSGSLAAGRAAATMDATVPVGDATLVGVVSRDPVTPLRRPQPWDPPDGADEVSEVELIVSTRPHPGTTVMRSHVPVLVVTESAALRTASAGDTVVVAGGLRDRSGFSGPDPYRATLRDSAGFVSHRATGPFFAPGNALRRLVLGRLGPYLDRPEGGLLAGFLVGDTSHVPPETLDALRRSGLTHYVAVSGSNVALFLVGWWLVIGVFPVGLRLRAASGLAALGVFVVVTRWEPSVVRAATMAAVVLGGRVFGVPVDIWRALGVAVTSLLLVSGDLSVDVGFQLSVAATVGVVVGARLARQRRPRWVWSVVVASIAAQIAVLPIVLLHFGVVPLLSPVANVLAAPLVVAATTLGGLGLLLSLQPMVDVAMLAASGVLAIAARASTWPQLGTAAALGALALVALLRLRRLRLIVAVGACVGVVAFSLPIPPPSVPVVTFLDVGQGDAVLIRDPGGATALVDGGPDPETLSAALARHGVTSIDLLVATHGDADHVAGLTGIFDRIPIGRVWHADHQPRSELLEAVLGEARLHRVDVVPVGTGWRVSLGQVTIDVLGPSRRFAAENDGSVVMWVSAGERTVLLAGDIERVAQRELAVRLPGGGPVGRPDVLQVPHHGSSTTDLRWLLETVGSSAVISVGENTYGHPSPEVTDALEMAGVEVVTTYDEGDISVPLCSATCGAPVQLG